ncbi:hypothetical protein ElyMa_001418400 [Elysia marginata]|uniref:Uncharacterized protein n=1 Tax=Elysia marginata TaxID=1093978 RepID=A0AAV4IW80_9GAST|nr:hypothetical protein ElyMa_001418400 [Elysia marginata]
MFRNMHDGDDLESSGSECGFSKDNDGSDADSATTGLSTCSASRDRSSRETQPGPCGARPAKTPRTSGDVLKEVNIDLDLETGNNFPFPPKNGREPGISPDLDLNPVDNPTPLRCSQMLFVSTL